MVAKPSGPVCLANSATARQKSAIIATNIARAANSRQSPGSYAVRVSN